MTLFYAIFGYFFQSAEFERGETPDAPPLHIYKRYPFFGFIQESKGVLAGVLNDQFGLSLVSDFKVDDAGVSFTKIYTPSGRTDKILYEFKVRTDQAHTWLGTYDGVFTDTDIARVTVIPIDTSVTETDPIADLHAIRKALGMRPIEAALEPRPRRRRR